MMNDLEPLRKVVPQTTFYFFISRKTHSLSLCLFKTHPRAGTPQTPRGLRRAPITQKKREHDDSDSAVQPPSFKEKNIGVHVHGGGALRNCVGVLIMAGSPSPMQMCHVTCRANVTFSLHFISTWNENKQTYQSKAFFFFFYETDPLHRWWRQWWSCDGC